MEKDKYCDDFTAQCKHLTTAEEREIIKKVFSDAQKIKVEVQRDNNNEKVVGTLEPIHEF